MLKIEKGLTIHKAIGGTKTHQMIKVGGEKATTEAYAGAIIMACEFFNVKPPMTEFQAVQTAILLVEQYPHETFEDFIFCLKKAKLGEYGGIFNRIDGHVIFDWFRQYLDEKYQAVEDMKRNEARELNGQGEVSENFQKNIQMVLKTIEEIAKTTPLHSIPRRNAKGNFDAIKALINKADLQWLTEMKAVYEADLKRVEDSSSIEILLRLINNKIKSL